jgi:hypothetical protein
MKSHGGHHPPPVVEEERKSYDKPSSKKQRATAAQDEALAGSESFGDMSSIMIMPDQIYNGFNLLDEGEEGVEGVVGVKSPITAKNKNGV